PGSVAPRAGAGHRGWAGLLTGLAANQRSVAGGPPQRGLAACLCDFDRERGRVVDAVGNGPPLRDQAFVLPLGHLARVRLRLIPAVAADRPVARVPVEHGV